MNPSVFDPVSWWARVDGARTALIEASSGVRHSYASLDADADRWCALLHRLDVRPGDRVAIIAKNRAMFVALFFGCVRANVTLVPLNWRLAAGELARVLGDADVSLLLGEDAFRRAAEDAIREANLPRPPRWLDIDRDTPLLLERGAGGAPRGAPDTGARLDTDAAMLLYTSGSTGMPKGVIISHRQIVWNAIATTTAWQLGANDVGPAATPFFHTGGWHVFTTPLLHRGGTVLMVDTFEPDEHVAMLRAYGVTVTFGVPTQLAMLRETAAWGEPLPSLRWFVSGGAPCPDRTKRAVREAGYRFREGYGLTECGPNCFATNDATAIERDGTVGWPITYLSMRLRGEDGNLASVGEIGELELKGPQLFGGYFRSPERTAEVMTSDGWLRTGDLASCDADGVHRIRGRRKEMFISGGENVFPGEVEAALLDCRGVLEVSVIGVPDQQWGEVGCALVVRRDPALDSAAVLSHARARLAAYKVPKRVQFVEAIPRLGSGKVDRMATGALIEPGTSR